MKLLKTFTDPIYPDAWFEIEKREAARTVLIDENNLIPIIYSENFDFCKIPGWGIDLWENKIDAAKREAMEECWSEIEILWEIWYTEEKRSATKYSWIHNLNQFSYWYYWKVLSKWETSFTSFEIKEWFKLLWLTYEEVIKKFESCNPQHIEWILLNQRDKLFLLEWYKLLQKTN